MQGDGEDCTGLGESSVVQDRLVPPSWDRRDKHVAEKDWSRGLRRTRYGGESEVGGEGGGVTASVSANARVETRK